MEIISMQALDVKQVAATIRADVTAYIDGTGPDKETQHLELGRKVGLNEDVISAAWTDAREKKKAVFISPPTSPTQNVAEKPLVENLRALTDWTEFCQSTSAALASGEITPVEAEGL